MRNDIRVDINCDMGEGINLNDIFPYISTANIACGFHAGDYETINETISLARKHGVKIGAHPSFPDKENFGRIEMSMTADEIYNMVVYQIGALQTMAKVKGVEMHHVKPHGALYNLAARDEFVAQAIAHAVKDVDKRLVLYGLSGSKLITAGNTIGLHTANEVFADRTYQANGSLTPRTEKNALIHNADEVASQVLSMVIRKTVKTTSGVEIPIQADTICIHGDGANAINLAMEIYTKLRENNISIIPVGA